MDSNTTLAVSPSSTRKARPQAKLTDKTIKSLKPGSKVYEEGDGNGLWLVIRPTGTKVWRWEFRYQGKAQNRSFGQYPAVSLSMARAFRDEGKELLARGINPAVHHKAQKQVQKQEAENTFRAVAKTWWDKWSKTTTVKHAEITWRRFERNVFPYIGDKPITTLKAPALIFMARAIEKRGASDLAKRALQSCGQVFQEALYDNIIEHNPAKDIEPSKVLQLKPKQNLARIEIGELPALLRKIDTYTGAPTTRFAIKLMAMTFVRTTELIAAPWSEIDLDEAVWRIPAERMKKRRQHIVPLSIQAVEVLRTLHTISGNGKLLFPGERDHEKPMSNNTILKALERMGFKGRMTGHGFRGLASTALHEQGFDHAHIELQLAHQDGNEVSAAYNHATYLAQRRDMMQKWSDYLDAVRHSKPRVVTDRLVA